MPFRHGIFIDEAIEGTRGLVTIASGVIGLVATAADADAAFFPLNRPVLVTDVRAALAKAGEQGTLARALEIIGKQCSPIVVVVRVAEGAAAGELSAAEATELNVIGGVTAQGQLTGMQALLAAEVQLGVRPRIIGAPGLDTLVVAQEIEIVTQRLRGFSYTGCDDAADVADAILYRNQFSAREHMLIFPDYTGWSGLAVATALGTRARIDEQMGPQKTLSNVAVNGVSGISKDIYFDLQDASTPAGLLNAAAVTTLIRQNGYRFWGNRTCSDDPLFAFESTVRVGQVLKDTVAQGLFWASDKPMTATLLVDVLETVNAGFRSLAAPGPRQMILGGKAWFDPSKNPNSDLAAGKCRIDFDYTVPAPLEDLGVNMQVTDSYYGTLTAG